jgi:signal transduction histidine kinase
MNSASEALDKAQKEILDQCIHRFSVEIRGARKLDRPIIVNTLPTLLKNMIQALDPNHPRALANESTSVAREHGSERARLTQYSPDQLLQEYQILRDTLFSVLQKKITLAEHDRSVIQKSIDENIQEAMLAYFLVHSRFREQFVVGLSHDLRNPLGAIKMAAEIMVDRVQGLEAKELKDDFIDLANRVIKNADRADRMIRDLIETSMVHFGEKIPINISEFDVFALIKDIHGEQEPKLQKRIVIEGRSTVGFWDKDGLRRALENLITNAIKYGDPDKPITIRVCALEERVQISVHNEGNPIKMENLEVLFQVFRRSAEVKKSGQRGWGIGLALVRGLTEAHGGSMLAESSLELGTTFTLDIPQDARPFQSAPTVEEFPTAPIMHPS